MGALVAPASADALEQALGSAELRAGTGEAALALDAEDGRYTIALQRVVYVKRYARESRVGFGWLPLESGLRVTSPADSGILALMADEATQAAARASKDSTAHVRRLVERGQQGDRAALEELYLLHFDRIYSYLHMSVGNRHDAEDLTTQTFLKMLES